MPFCRNCGAKLPEGAFFCGDCGSPVYDNPPAFPQQNQTNSLPRTEPSYPRQEPASYAPQNRTSYAAPNQNACPPQRPAETSAPRATNWTGTSAPIPYNTTGLWIWSLFCLLMLLIPGVIAISNTAQINKCDTAEQQEKHIKTARIACIIGTVLGALIIIGRLAQGA